MFRVYFLASMVACLRVLVGADVSPRRPLLAALRGSKKAEDNAIEEAMSEEEVEELETLEYSLMSSPGLQISVKAAEEANVLAKKAEDKAIEGVMSEEEVEELETLQYSLMNSPGLQMSVK